MCVWLFVSRALLSRSAESEAAARSRMYARDCTVIYLMYYRANYAPVVNRQHFDI